MKTTITLMLLSIFSLTYSQEIASSCCSSASERGCTGSSYCTACKNCSGCKHCAKNGGSCGACSGRSSKKSYKSDSSTSKNKKNKSSSSTKQNIKSPDQPKTVIAYRKDDYLTVSIDELNVRQEANSSSKILEKLKKNSKVKFIKAEGSWYKVEIVNSKTIGYVYSKHVK